MLALFRKRLTSKNDEGFTLIELLIVIVILGILAAIVVFAIGKTRGDSVTAACKSSYKQVDTAAEAVKTKSGQYPSLLTASASAVNTGTPILASAFTPAAATALVPTTPATGAVWGVSILNDLPVVGAAGSSTPVAGADAGSLGKSVNPLDSSGIKINSGTADDVPYDNGALLKKYPVSSDYALRYTPIITTATSKATDYAIEVGTLSGTTFSPVGAGKTNAANGSADDCASL